MDPAEDTSLEAAILWLVGTILATLVIDKFDEWIGQVGLAGDVKKLKSEIQRVKMMIAGVKGRAIGNEPLAEALAITKELLYEADDVVDELDYYRLQQQVEGVKGPEGVTPIHTERSAVWKNFTVIREDGGKPAKVHCNYCDKQYPYKPANGTSTMDAHTRVKHRDKWDESKAEAPLPKTKKSQRTRTNEPRAPPPNPSSTGDAPGNATQVEVGSSSRGKRKRTDEEPAQTTPADTYIPWDKAELSNRIKTVTSQLQGILETLNKGLERHGSCCVSSLNHHQSTILDQNRRTSSLAPGKVYGRDAEKDFIIKMITEDQSDVVTVLPIVGIAGVGKTALAQLVYNDPKVKSQFHHRIWVWVSRNFDEVRITREILDFVSPKTNEGSSHRNERHEGISSFAKLQEILKEHMEYREHKDGPFKKFLLILDDVWDNLEDHQWNKLLAPSITSQVKGNVILVTTRNLSVAQRLGTLNLVKLSALAADDFWLLFKSRAFGSKNDKGNQSLNIIGRKIAKKLKGNPLAAETAGELLRKDLTVDHWSSILKGGHWKSLQLSTGIMPAIKLSYDHLPFYLQQCFSHTSVFPSSHEFLGKELVGIWISQGFVECSHSGKRLEEIGQHYLTELVNLGFFQQVEEKEDEQGCSLGSQIRYSICGLMHDFARMISRNECATIDGLHCSKMLPTIRHLSIVTDSAYGRKDQHGNIPRNEKFEGILRNAVTSVSKLRTLVLLGDYDSSFFQLVQDIFQKAGNLRLLQMSATIDDFDSLVCSLADPAHLRYLQREPDGWVYNCFPQYFSKLYHLQVLDVDSDTDTFVPDGLHNLVSLRHLVAKNGVDSSIANIGSMTSLQELRDFKVQSCSSGFEITQLQVMNELVQLGVSQLDNVKTREEAYGAGLRNKQYLKRLHLSWKDKLSADEESTSDASFESSEEKDEEPSQTDKEVLQGLEPHVDLKHLQISGYRGANPPTWLDRNISVTSLQTLHLHSCGELQRLPSLLSLPFLTKLKLSSMREVSEVLVPSLEELVLIKMPKLLGCTSVKGLSSSLRVLQIERCHTLEVFDLFKNDHEFEIKQSSWLPGLRKLVLLHCPRLKVLRPLPPSTTCSELLITGISVLPSMKGSSSEELRIGHLDDDNYEEEDRGRGIDESSNELRILDDKILVFSNLRNLKSMRIVGCRNLISFSFEGFSHLVCLRSLEISLCEQLFSSDGMPDASRENMTTLNCKAFPSLGRLDIESCGIQGKWLSRMLQHAPQLEKLRLNECPHITAIILTEEGENSKSNHMLAREDSSLGNAPDAPTGLVRDERLHIPLQTPSSLNNITIINGPDLFDLFEDDDKFEIEQRTSLHGLRKLVILSDCPRLEVLSPLPPSTTASELFVRGVSLPSMQGSSSENLCIGHPEDYGNNFIDELRILDDKILAFRNLGNLKSMTIEGCRNLTYFSFEGFSHLVSLKKLKLHLCEKLFSSDVIAECILEDVTAFPSLQSLSIVSCGITGEWLCLLLQHAPVLEDLHLVEILEIQEGDLLPGDYTLTLLAQDRFVQIPLNIISSLKKASIHDCPRLKFKWSEEGFSGCTSLQELKYSGCPQLLSSLVHNDGNDDPANRRLLLPASIEGLVISENYSVETLQPCFPSDLTSLKRLELRISPDLESLQLRSCTALEILVIAHCKSLTALEGLQSLGSLRHLEVYSCPGLGPCLESFFSRQGYELCSRLETFDVDEPSVFSTSSCVGLTSLQRLKLQELVLTEEQGRALGLLTSLQELEFYDCYNLVDLPAGLHLLPSLQQLQFIYCPELVDLPVELHAIPSLKRLKIQSCKGILRLPETGLPHSLEELEIEYCSKELADQCSLLAATSKLRVKIDGHWLVL